MNVAETMSDTLLKALKMTHRMLAGLLFVALISSTPAKLTLAGEAIKQHTDGCNIHMDPCTKVVQEGTITLNVDPKPVKAMKDLTFTVTISGAEPSADPYVDLGMPGMQMGPNRIQLKRTGHGRYQGEGVIVRCPSGRRTWQATVTVPGAGQAEFIFDVIY
jgi:hypothetical protein